MSESVALGPGGEFDIIRDLVRRWGSAARGIGDDAAVLEVPAGERLVVSTDAAVENVHFRRAWLTPFEIGYRAATAALSDLAAMAALPLGMLVAMSVPERWRAELGDVADGIGAASRDAGAPIVGGNLTAADELALITTVLGHAARPLARSGARVGDALYVTGLLGGSRSALDALAAGGVPSPEARARLVAPRARIREAAWLAAHGATAAIDVSDGLVADAGHLAAASGVTVCIELDAIPTLSGVTPLVAASSGEEYELLIASSAAMPEHEFAREFGLPLTRVGVVQRDTPGEPRVRVRSRGVFVDLPRGHDHFSR